MLSAEDVEAIRAGLGRATKRGVEVAMDDDGDAVAVHVRIRVKGLLWHAVCDVPRDLFGPFTGAGLARAVVRDVAAYWAGNKHRARAPLPLDAESA
jgi:hypothetical protein